MDGNARKQVADDREQPVEQVSVIALHAMWPTVETVAEDSVGVTFKDWFKKLRIIDRVVFEVGILYEDDFAGGSGKAGANARSFPHVFLVERQLYSIGPVIAKFGLHVALLKKFARSVAGEVIDDDDFFVQAHRLMRNLTQQLHHGSSLVIDRDDNGEGLKMTKTWVATVHGELDWHLSIPDDVVLSA